VYTISHKNVVLYIFCRVEKENGVADRQKDQDTQIYL